MKKYNLRPPLTNETIELLRSGDKIVLSGEIYTARDAAHSKMANLLLGKKDLPFDPKGQVIYYVGPTPAKPGQVIGSAGPTTSGRMDAYTTSLLEAGLKGMIGKGARSESIRRAIQKHKAVYFAALGGAAVLMAKCIKQVEVIAYPELGTEAIRKLTVVDMPLIVINDSLGNDLYELGKLYYQRL